MSVLTIPSMVVWIERSIMKIFAFIPILVIASWTLGLTAGSPIRIRDLLVQPGRNHQTNP